MTTHSHDPGPFTWHPAIDTALRDRVVLREALQQDGQLVHHVRLLSLFLSALDRRTWRTPPEELGAALAADLLPSDRDIINARTIRAAATREAAKASIRPFEQRCPECLAGKHINCTGGVLDASDELVPCTCTGEGCRS